MKEFEISMGFLVDICGVYMGSCDIENRGPHILEYFCPQIPQYGPYDIELAGFRWTFSHMDNIYSVIFDIFMCFLHIF